VVRIAAATGLATTLAAGLTLQASAQPKNRTPNSSARRAGVTAKGGGYAGWAMRARPHPRVAVPQFKAPQVKKISGVPGIDVSSYQGNVNWKTWRDKGKRFAYTKATEGTSYHNPYFSQQYNGSYNAGMIRGAYHFARPDGASGAAQARYFVAHGGGWSADGKTLPGMLDLEDNYNGTRCYGKTPSQLVSWVRSFLNEYRAETSRDAPIYTNSAFWRDCLNNTTAFNNTNPLWIAAWSANPPKSLPGHWPYYTIWQYSGWGEPEPGTDQDAFNGNMARLKVLATGGKADDPADPKTDPQMGAPAAVSWGTGRVDVFARDLSTHHVMHKWYKNGSWHGWSDLGGKIQGAPAAASWKRGRIDLVVTGQSGHVFHKAYRRHSWTKWTERPGVRTHSGPAAASWSKGRLDVLARDGRNRIRHMAYRHGGWMKKWSNLGGNAQGAPAATSWGKNRLDIAATGRSGHVFHRAYRRHSWTKWTKRPGVTTHSGPAITSWGKGRVDVFAQDSRTHHLRHTLYRNGKWLGHWTSQGGAVKRAPAVTTWGKTRLEVIATGRHSNQVYEKYYQHGWSKWHKIG
jgi:GH25 family lysozyme M1 (1,4-beta-N-acetylmuramidase)